MFKKIGVLLLLIGAAILIGLAIYNLFFIEEEVVLVPIENVNEPGVGLPPAAPGAPGVPVPPPTELPPTAVSPIAAGGLTQVTPVAPVPTVGASVSASGAMNYYNKNDGKFYRLNNDGSTSLLSNKTFFNVSNATFDPVGNKAILEYPDGANVFYDFATATQVTLPAHWEEFDFSSSGDQIVAKSIATDPDNRFLIVSNPDGTAARPVQELGVNADKVQVDWSPNNQVIATATTGRKFGVDRQEIYLLGQYGENFKSMVVEGLNFQPKWAPSGQQMVYSVAGSLTDWKPSLWIVDAKGDDIGRNRKHLNVPTFAEKCTFASDSTMYCAIPRSMPRGAGLQPAILDSTPDDLYRIDLTTGLQTLIAVPEGDHTVSEIMLTPDQKTLFFTDKTTGVLNTVKLAQ